VTGASASGLITRFVAPDVDLRGPDVAAHAVRWLATVDATDQPFVRPPGGRFGDGTGLALIVVSGAADAPLDAVRSMLAADDIPIIVCTRTAPHDPDRFVLDATDDERFAESWSRLVGPRGRAGELSINGNITR
jgi:hypothetical protein